jgi:hypothetical protein
MEIVNNFKRGQIANCLALHEITHIPTSAKGWIQIIIDYFNKYGLTPTRMSLSGEYYNSKNTVSFKYGLRALEKHNYEGLTGLSMYALPPNHDIDMFDGIFIAEINFDKTYGDYIAFCFDNNIVPFDKSFFQELTVKINSFFKPLYGYIYQRKFSEGPNHYPFGVIGGSEVIEDTEEKKIGEWGRVYSSKRYRTGLLRDIYPYNILTSAHLEQVINGETLEQWIKKNSSHGTLEKITDDHWLWSLTPEQIPAVQEALYPSGILLCYIP